MDKKNNKEVKEDKISDETIMYKPVNPNNAKKQKNPKKPKNPKEKKKHPKLKKFLKVILVMFILGCVIVGGILSAIVYRCIWGDWAIDKDDLMIKFENTTMFDKNGNAVAVLTGDENREIISKDEMSPYLFNAFISIEDERFDEHHGVDWYRTLGAFTTFITHSGESSFGGSTITQQVVKNLTGEDESSAIEGALRKIKEIVRAHEIENILSKDQVLELYLNLIPLGGGGNNIYGVQMASIYYFNKNANEIGLVEAAYLAGITSAPNKYNPFDETMDRSETINAKVKTVLKKMYELGRITEEEYNNGLAQVDAGIAFSKGEISQNNKLSYYLEAARDQIIDDLMEKNNWSKEEAKIHLYGDGYHIYTAFDPSVQAEVDDQFVNNASKWYITIKANRTDAEGNTIKVDEQRQGAMVVIDNETGYVVAGAGGLGEKTVAYGTNRIYQTRHNPGSCMKPIAVVGPSLEEGIITLGTVVDDVPVKYGSYTPHNWYLNQGYYGFMGMREILGRSANVPEVILLKELTVAKSLSYLDKLGINVEGEENDGLSLALGGMTNGMSTIEMAAAYAAIQNGGVYRAPKFYSKITDSAENLIMESDKKEVRVFSEQNAWLLLDLMKEPIYSSYATGSRARIANQDVRGKTGTTNNNTAAWFAGFTRYYTAAVWLGFDVETDGTYYQNADSGLCSALYATIMAKVHSGLEKKSWDKPGGITTATICNCSGLLATDACRNDPRGSRVITEYFATGTQPKEYCSTHVTASICNATGLVATENCKDTKKQVFLTRQNADKSSAWRSAVDAKYMLPTKKCDEKEPEEPEEGDDNIANNTANNNTNTNTNSNTNTNNTNTNTNNSTNTNNTNTNTNNTNTNTNNTNTNNTNTNTNSNKNNNKNNKKK